MPASDLGENRSDVNRTHGDPHQQAADLLVTITRQAPTSADRAEHSQSIDRVLVNRTNRDWGKGKDNAKHAASSAGGKSLCASRGANPCHQNTLPIIRSEVVWIAETVLDVAAALHRVGACHSH